MTQDPDSEVFRYYSIANKLDDTWFSGAYALASSCMSIFEANGYSRSDGIAVNSYSQYRSREKLMLWRLTSQSFRLSGACSTVFELKIRPRR